MRERVTIVSIKNMVKRDGRIVEFDKEKITVAIFKAAKAVGGDDKDLANELSDLVVMFLEKTYIDEAPTLEDIQDMVEKVLMETGHAKTAKAYILYRAEHSEQREKVRVRTRVSAGESDSTDLHLLVDPTSRDEFLKWDRSKIVEALEIEAGVDNDTACDIAASVERRVVASKIERISSALIRELVDNELFERGFTVKLQRQQVLGMPKYDIEKLIFAKSNENSNITSNNPEAINLAIAETTLKQYALQEIFTPDVSDAHMSGLVHLHDLGYPTRVYCSSHSLEYIKKYGLQLDNLDTRSNPAKHARTLTGHLNTFLASMQAYYAGALGVAYINIMYAPYVENMTAKQMRQEAQHLIYSSSQNAFSRGGQTLFLDFNIHSGIPTYLANVEAIGSGGKYTGRKYGEYAQAAMDFTRAMLDVWRDGDANGRLFAFPKCDFHVTEESFTDPAQLELLNYACQISAENGVPYFVFDRDEVTLSACCRLRTTVTDNYMLDHPESMRFCGFQNVTINLPQCGYRAGDGGFDALCREIDAAMDIAMRAHLQKKQFAKKLMASPEMPLWEVGHNALDGRPYVDLEDATYIVGLIGLNETLNHVFGFELHEGDEALIKGLEVLSYMHMKAKELGEKHGLKVTLEESPAESAARRMAKIDLQNYPEAARAVLSGSIEDDELFYSNSVHLRANADVDLIERIEKQALFHGLIESGAIIHAFIGESRPSPESIFSLVKKTWDNTNAAQLTISPEFTLCGVCGRTTPGLHGKCGWCDTVDVYGLERALDGIDIKGAKKRLGSIDIFEDSND